MSETQAAVAQIYLPHVGKASNAEAAAVNATTVYKYYLFNGQRMAMTVNGSLRYLHADQLGSTVLTTYTSGARESERGYYAFGSDRRVVGTPATDHRFTGQKLDGTGLYYYNARYYDPVIGQFVSPDTIVPEPNQVFAYNRYMYVMGNPLKYTDPTGHRYDPFGFGGGGGGSITGAIIALSVAGNAGGNYIGQVAANWDQTRTTGENLRDFNGGEVAVAVTAGAASGVCTVATSGGGAVLCNGGVGAAQDIITDMAVYDEPFSDAFGVDTFISAGINIAAGTAAGKVPKQPALVGGTDEHVKAIAPMSHQMFSDVQKQFRRSVNAFLLRVTGYSLLGGASPSDIEKTDDEPHVSETDVKAP